MKSTAPAFRFFGEFKDQQDEYTVTFYTHQLSATVTSTQIASGLVGKILELAVQKNRTKQMQTQYEAIEDAFRIQIEQEREQMLIILTEYEEQLVDKIQTYQKELELKLKQFKSEIEKQLVQNKYTLQKLKQEYSIKKQIIEPLYHQKRNIKKFYDAISKYENFEEINELADAYFTITSKIQEVEQILIKG